MYDRCDPFTLGGQTDADEPLEQNDRASQWQLQ